MVYNYSSSLNLAEVRATDIIHFECQCGKSCEIQKRKFTKPLCRACKLKEAAANGSYLKGREKAKQTCLQKYGVENPMQVSTIKEKALNTQIERYGDIVVRTDSMKEKSKETLISHFGSLEAAYSLRHEKAEKTCLDNNGCLQSELMQQGLADKRQSDDNFQKIIDEKRKATNNERYGGNSPMCNADVCKKSKQTFAANHNGKKSTFADNEVQEKSKQTLKEKYGVDHPSRSPELLSRARRKYRYNGLNFDSGWELAYYIWLSDNNIPFTFHPDLRYSYQKNGEEHFYCPDFIVDGKIVEIKGNQFFNENNDPFDAYHKCFWKEKFQLLVDLNVTVMREADIIPMLNYVADKCGKGYIKSFKQY